MAKRPETAGGRPWTRRDFVHGTVAAVPMAWVGRNLAAAAPGDSHAADPSRWVFTARGNEFSFDTGALRGTLRSQGHSRGLVPAIDEATGAAIAKGAGLLSHYRLLDAKTRYGTAAWDWTSRSRRRPDGAVEVIWNADADHPFDLSAVYRWSASNALDVTTRVTAHQPLSRFESFLACYFDGFPASFVYVRRGRPATGPTEFFEATKSFAVWQMFPRDDRAEETIRDGRWTRPPNPVQWRLGPRLAAPLAIRRDAKTGLVALVMAPREDCFAVATPYGEEGHRSIYLSLFGGDLNAGQEATARSRLVIGHGISNQQAVARYDAYLNEI